MSARKTSHRRSLAIICLVVTGGAMTLNWLRSEITGFKLEVIAENFVTRHSRLATASDKIVFLAIDANSQTLDDVWSDELERSQALQLMKEGWPWRRDIYPLILDRLVNAGASSVVFDLLLPSLRDGDDVFQKALDRYRDHVVIGANFPERTDEQGTMGAIQWPSTSLIANPGPDDPRIGFVTVFPDRDEVVRRVWYSRTLFDVLNMAPVESVTPLESLAARGLRQAGYGKVVPWDRKPRIIRFTSFTNWKKDDTVNFAPISLYRIFVQTYWEKNFHNGEFFKDKIVVIGPSGNWSKDDLATPFGRINGPLLHLNAMNAALQGEFLEEVPQAMQSALIALGGLISWVLGYFIRSPRWRIVTLFGAAGAWLGLTILLHSARFVVPVVYPVVALVVSGLAFLFVEYLLEQRERLRIRATLERYVSKDIVKEVLDNPESFIAMGGGRRKIAILFSDIRGFTSMIEEGDEEKLVTQLNEYFHAMVRIVFEHQGTLDKFIGDAIMAHWGAVVSRGEKEDACLAVSAALKMLEKLQELNVGWKERDLPALRIGLGLNYGQVVCAHLGAEDRHEFTAIGDHVNLASRLEGATKALHLEMLIGETMAPLVGERFILQTADLLKVVGKTRPVEVFTVLGERNGTPEPEWLAKYEEGVRLYRQRKFNDAKHALEAADAKKPDDWLIREYLRRCRTFLVQPPGPEWDGVFVMEKK